MWRLSLSSSRQHWELKLFCDYREHGYVEDADEYMWKRESSDIDQERWSMLNRINSNEDDDNYGEHEDRGEDTGN